MLIKIMCKCIILNIEILCFNFNYKVDNLFHKLLTLLNFNTVLYMIYKEALSKLISK